VHASVKRHTGFSLTELVVALAVAMILMAVGLPAFLRAYHSYQLSNAATQVADILRLARYEAIRLNTPVQCLIRASGTNTSIWVDSIPNTNPDPTEKICILGPSGNLVGSSVPNASALNSQAVNTFAVNAPSPTSSAIKFDARGALVPATSVNVFYLASPNAPEAGYRAVFLAPAGSIQIWTADAAGNWQHLR